MNWSNNKLVELWKTENRAEFFKFSILFIYNELVGQFKKKINISRPNQTYLIVR